MNKQIDSLHFLADFSRSSDAANDAKVAVFAAGAGAVGARLEEDDVTGAGL